MRNSKPNSSITASDALHDALGPSEVGELELIEMLYFAYRDFVHEPDEILQRDNFGRSHHRILHFINRQPGLSVADLLDILKITKQSLAPSLRQLIDKGYVLQETCETDRRKRLLFPTRRGRELMLALCVPQSQRMASALADMSDDGRETVLKFLLGIVHDEDRDMVRNLTNA